MTETKQRMTHADEYVSRQGGWLKEHRVEFFQAYERQPNLLVYSLVDVHRIVRILRHESAQRQLEIVALRAEDKNLTQVRDAQTEEAHRMGARIGDGVDLISEERLRQLVEEGWTPAHDDRHTEGDLCDAACAYATAAQATYYDDNCVTFADIKSGKPPKSWPWEASWWKPSDDPIRNLAKAGALIAAEIDRLIRRESTLPAPPTAGEP